MANVDVIKNRINNLEDRQKQVKEAHEKVKDILEQDNNYIDLLGERREIDRKIKAMKDNILMGLHPDLLQELGEINEEIKTLKQILDAELLGYYTTSSESTILTDDGIREIVFKAKLVKTKQQSLGLYNMKAEE